MKKSAILVAAAACLSLSAFAQSSVNSASGVTVTSGTGVVVTPGVRAASPLPTTVMGAGLVHAGETTVVQGRDTIVTTRYWSNVPADVSSNAAFQRWQRLR